MATPNIKRVREGEIEDASGAVSWAVATILMAFTAAATFGVSLCLQALDEE